MTYFIDGERLEAWLVSQRDSLTASAQERHEADDERDEDGQVVHQDHTALRMDGGLANLFIIMNSLHNFVVESPQRARAPMDQIEVPVRFKVRRHDHGTSWEAAYLQAPERTRRLFRAIYLILQHKGPSTDYELTQYLDAFIREHRYSPNSIWKRRGELTQAGWVRATEEKRPSEFGAQMTVWEAVPEDL